jgi:hypothetical protein
VSLAERLIALEHEGCEPYAADVSTAFVRDGDVWKVAFHQQSPKP